MQKKNITKWKGRTKWKCNQQMIPMQQYTKYVDYYLHGMYSHAYSMFEITLTHSFVHLSQKFRCSFTQRFFWDSIQLWYHGLMTNYIHEMIFRSVLYKPANSNSNLFNRYVLCIMYVLCFIFQKTVEANVYPVSLCIHICTRRAGIRMVA